jgi:hypothetical protein
MSVAASGALAQNAPAKAVEIRHTDTPRRIDGVTEEERQVADSANGSVQPQPHEMTTPTERTAVCR